LKLGLKFASFWVVLHIGTRIESYETGTQNWSNLKPGSGTETETTLQKQKSELELELGFGSLNKSKTGPLKF
jgi:hypothetical protein